MKTVARTKKVFWQGFLAVCLVCLVFISSCSTNGESDTVLPEEETALPTTTPPEGNTVVSSAVRGGTEGRANTTVLPESTNTSEPKEEPTVTVTDTDVPLPTNTNTPLPTLTKRPTATPNPQVEVVSSSANVRSGPGTNYEVLGVLTEGETAILLGRTQDSSWYNVRLEDGTLAWIAASVVETANIASIQLVRVVGTIPAPPVAAVATNPPSSTNTPIPAQPTFTLPPAATELPPTAVPAPTEPPPPPPVAVCDCSGNIYNCSDFGSHAQAQACFAYCVSQGVGDIHDLDRDNDGVACESLP